MALQSTTEFNNYSLFSDTLVRAVLSDSSARESGLVESSASDSFSIGSDVSTN